MVEIEDVDVCWQDDAERPVHARIDDVGDWFAVEGLVGGDDGVVDGNDDGEDDGDRVCDDDGQECEWGFCDEGRVRGEEDVDEL